MPPKVALFVCLCLVMWLFLRDRKLCPMVSWDLWIPLLWLILLGTKPVSLWFGGGISAQTPTDLIDGSPVDRLVFLLGIVAGLVVLWRRQLDWGRIFASNRWIFILFAYWCISTLWSDYPFVSLKRWVKDIGNLIMVVIVFTENNPKQALQAVFRRFIYIVIPFSVLLIKYFPEFGRYYSRGTWAPVYQGVTGGKNGLGALLLLSGLFLFWDFIERRSSVRKKMEIMDLFSRGVLLLMIIWLIIMANSMTSLVCLLLGILIVFRIHFILKHLSGLSVAITCMVFLVFFVPEILEITLGMVGRNLTLTGRTDLWRDILKAPINPLFGTGYQSFWMLPFIEHLWEIYVYHPNQAHNGYIETYLNGGFIGVGILMATIISTANKLRKGVLFGGSVAIFLFSFFVIMLIYSYTEAIFNEMSPLWLLFLLACFVDLSLPKPVTPPQEVSINKSAITSIGEVR